MENILELDFKDAKKYFMNENNYFTYLLPSYFSFKKILEEASKLMDNKKEIKNVLKISGKKHVKLNDYNNVNFEFIIKKSSNNQWRKLQIIHPVLYVDLVNYITKEENWEELKSAFKNNSTNEIDVESIPLLENEKHIEKTINYWWKNFEQEIIKLNLQYCYMGITDISNCYSSIYTHSISWAIYGIEKSKENKNTYNFGNNIDKKIQNMSYGQTNGIPEGSVIMDLIAELVLSYGDKLIVDELKKKNINEYHIIRYRDDYRIFSNKKDDINKILATISSTLIKLNLKLNNEKTKVVENILSNSIKPEKQYLINHKLNMGIGLQKYAFQIFSFNKAFPNNKQVNKLLELLYYKIKIYKPKKNAYQIISILVQLIIENPQSINNCILIISCMLDYLPKDKSKEIKKQIKNKLLNQPLTTELEIWVQRLFIKDEEIKIKFENLLSNSVDTGKLIWNSEWLDYEFNSSIISLKAIQTISNVIKKKEALKIFDIYDI